MGCGASRVLPADEAAAVLEPSRLEFLEDGSLADPRAARAAVQRSGGLAAPLRARLWPPLLSLLPWDAAAGARAASDEARRAVFVRLLDGEVDARHRKVIDGDVPRTDRERPEWRDERSLAPLRQLLMAHCVHSPWGYSQGMADLAAVVLVALGPSAVEHSPRGADSDASAARLRDVAGDAPSPPPRSSNSDAASLSVAFWAFEAILNDSAPNWCEENLRGVWLQARAVLAVLRVEDPTLAKQILAIESTPLGTLLSEEQPFAFLFQPILLRLKREMRDYEQACRLWEVTWAMGGLRFSIVLLVAYIQSQRAHVMKLRPVPLAMADLHRTFSSLVGTMEASPLLNAARRLWLRPRVHTALGKTELFARTSTSVGTVAA
ncbi:hypothetical protein AB1Y20_017429 [Prymnesium parvum]|uniref:Rab-GAP TBC domain-containing protein n=1 Tax=Prymnesium parvum TaxID=97485 RepID=A0AB34JKG1_PRYPA